MIFLLLLPASLLIMTFFSYPIIRYGWLSMHASSVITGLEPVYNNGANWYRLISDQRFWIDLFQTTRFACLSVILELILAIFIALILDQRWRGRGLVRALTLLPWALPTTVMALGWRWIFNSPYGPIEQLIQILGYDQINILSDPNFAWIGTVLADVWKTTPFVTLILLAGIQTIPEDLYEAFRLEGGKPLSALMKITIPLLQPYILVCLLFRLAQAFGVFDLIQVLTGGGPSSSTESLAMYAYINAMRFLDFGYSATIMMASFIILIAAYIFSWITLSKIKDLTEA